MKERRKKQKKKQNQVVQANPVEQLATHSRQVTYLIQWN